MAHPYRRVDGTETARLDCNVSPDTRRGPSALNTPGTSAPQAATGTLTGRTTAQPCVVMAGMLAPLSATT
jgi:hypothetical protein